MTIEERIRARIHELRARAEGYTQGGLGTPPPQESAATVPEYGMGPFSTALLTVNDQAEYVNVANSDLIPHVVTLMGRSGTSGNALQTISPGSGISLPTEAVQSIMIDTPGPNVYWFYTKKQVTFGLTATLFAVPFTNGGTPPALGFLHYVLLGTGDEPTVSISEGGAHGLNGGAVLAAGTLLTGSLPVHGTDTYTFAGCTVVLITHYPSVS